MGFYQDIEAKLAQIDATKFEEIIKRILSSEYNDAKIVRVGKVSGKNKTKKGTPDTYFQIYNGEYVFVEVTTQQTKN